MGLTLDERHDDKHIPLSKSHFERTVVVKYSRVNFAPQTEHIPNFMHIPHTYLSLKLSVLLSTLYHNIRHPSHCKFPNLRNKSRTTEAVFGSVSTVLTAWHVKMASRSFLVTPAFTSLFSMTSPALCSYWSSTMSALISQRTTGWGWPPTVRQVRVMSSPSSCGPTVPFNWRPHLSKMVGCSGGTVRRTKWTINFFGRTRRAIPDRSLTLIERIKSTGVEGADGYFSWRI